MTMFMPNKSRLTYDLLKVLAALSIPAAAVAQGTPATDDGGLEEIIVTAQKRAEPLQTVPVSVSAFSSQALQNSNTGSIAGLQGLVPGMTITRSGASPNTPQMSLRGISLQDVEKSTESGIGFVIDGVPLGSHTGALLGAFDVERIEVLRGPQGLLFGKNTTGGTINVIRSRPDPNGEFSGKLRFTLGSFGRNDYEAVITAPLIPGKLAAKGAITVQKHNGEYKNTVFGGRNGDRDFRNYIFTLNATPTDRLSMLLTFERQEDDSEIPPYIPIPVPQIIALGAPGYFGGRNSECTNPFLLATCVPLNKKRNTVEIQPPEPAFFNLNAVTFEGSYDLDSVKLVGITGYRKSKESQTSDFDGTRFALFRDRRPQTYRQFSQEVRAESSFDGPFNFVAGAFFFSSRYQTIQRASLDLAAVAPIAPGISFLNSAASYTARLRSRSVALFFQGEYDITDALKLSFGARQTWDRKKLHFTTFAPVPSAVRDNSVTGPVTGDRRATANFKKLTPKVGLEYKIAPDILAYASYSRGYNTGGFNGRAPSVTLIGPFEPEVMDAFEFGWKTEFFNRRVRWNVAMFQNTLKNKQEDVLTFVGTVQGTTTVNAAKARYRGVEAELAVAPIRGWTISTSAGYLHAKYLSYFGNLGQGAVDLSGLKLRRTPKWTAGAISDYVFDAGTGKVGLNASLYHVSGYHTNVLNDPRGHMPKTLKADLAVRYMFPVGNNLDLEVSGFVKNVTDSTIYTGQSSGNSVGTFLDFANPAVGRTWGASLTAKF